MFFALSGFLVAGSLARSASLFEFFSLRVLRLGPAFGVAVLLTSVILGPMLTMCPLQTYFSDPAFFRYLKTLQAQFTTRFTAFLRTTPLQA
jgi:peptidoglycan/LPS O-acetylase OafA/YrhL